MIGKWEGEDGALVMRIDPAHEIRKVYSGDSDDDGCTVSEPILAVIRANAPPLIGVSVSVQRAGVIVHLSEHRSVRDAQAAAVRAIAMAEELRQFANA